MYQKAQNAALNVPSAAGSLGSARPVCVAPDAPQPGRLEGPANRLDDLVTGFHELNLRLHALADRLLGSVPEPVGENMPIAGSPLTTVGRYERITDSVSANMRRFSDTLERLEQL